VKTDAHEVTIQPVNKAACQFVYCNSSFAPSPDQKLSSLFAVCTDDATPGSSRPIDAWLTPSLSVCQCFQAGDVLVLNYSLTQAWG
jgi:hypothetical protein